MFGALRETAARADFVCVALALAVYATSIPLVALRWRAMLRGVTGRVAPLGSLVLGTLASTFVNNITPAARLGGEACRVVTLVRMRLATTPQAAAAAAYERLSEVPAVAGLAMATLFVVGRMSFGTIGLPVGGARTLGLWVASGCALGVALAVLMRGALGRWGSRMGGRIRARWRPFAAIRVAPSAFVISALISAVIWMLDVGRLRLAAAAFHAPIGLPQAATLTAITIVAGWVPTVGGLGAIEGGLVAGLVSMGVPPADAIAITVVERSISYGIGTLAGLVSLSLLGGRSLWRAVRVGPSVPEGATT